ncbi:MAG: hypothetical protein Q8P33_02245, partial [bacterium]|nr:hypothetical protein [bacterium]
VFIKALEDLGATDEDFDKIDNHELVRELAKSFLGARAVVHQGLRVVLDRTKTVKQLVSDGQCDWRNDEINANIKLVGTGPDEVWVEYVHLGREASDAEVDAEHERQGLTPIEPEYMLALGAQHPEEQRKHPIASMYTAWAGPDRDQRLLYIFTGRHGRDLDLGCRFTGGRWSGCTRFAARRKSPALPLGTCP